MATTEPHSHPVVAMYAKTGWHVTITLKLTLAFQARHDGLGKYFFLSQNLRHSTVLSYMKLLCVMHSCIGKF